jgi:hypothetical protein
MPSRRKNLTGKAILRRIKQGRGRGERQNYQPWLKVTDVPSRGTSTRFPSPKSERTQHLLSRGEYRHNLLALFSHRVRDIREQFPLDLKDTLRIAKELGVHHPADRGKEIVMTTDFLFTVQAGHDLVRIARTYKRKIDLHGRRLFEKLEIERRYWAERHVDWGLVTDADIPEAEWRNVDWIADYWTVEQLGMPIPEIQRVAQCLISAVQRERIITISSLTSECDRMLKLDRGTASRVFRFLIANRVLVADMSSRIRTTKAIAVSIGNRTYPEK